MRFWGLGLLEFSGSGCQGSRVRSSGFQGLKFHVFYFAEIHVPKGLEGLGGVGFAEYGL